MRIYRGLDSKKIYISIPRITLNWICGKNVHLEFVYKKKNLGIILLKTSNLGPNFEIVQNWPKFEESCS